MDENKVIRLQFQAITSHLSYLMKEMPPEPLVPQLVERGLLSPSQAAKVLAKGTSAERVFEIVNNLQDYNNALVGQLPTLCDILINLSLQHVAHKLFQKFQTLMKGERVSYQQEEDEIMISGESSVQLSPPPPGSYLVTTQVEGSTLTRSQYQNVCSLISSLLCIPTGDLVYDGYTINPTTIHWHTAILGEMFESISLLTEMSQQQIKHINVPWTNYDLTVPTSSERKPTVVPQMGIIADSTSSFPEMDLLNASMDGDLNLFNSSLGNGSHPDFVSPALDGDSPLRLACYKGHVTIIERLMEHGATLNPEDQDEYSPLMIASAQGHINIVNYLIEHGAKIHQPKKGGWTSLMYACYEGQLEVVEVLLQHGANLTEQNEVGATPLIMASCNGHVDVVEKLIQHKANVDIQCNDGTTALMCACINNHIEVVRTLIDHHSTLDLQHQTGQTPLLLAVRKNNVAMVRELVKARVDVDHMEQGGLSALMMCCEEGNSEMAKLLLQSGANPNLQQSSTGYTALMFASHGGYLDTVVVLMDNGANLHIKNRSGNTALDVASANMHPEICSELMCWNLQQLPEDNQTKENNEKNLNGPCEDVKDVVRRVYEQIDQVAQDTGRITGKKIPKGDYKSYMELRAKGSALLKSSRKKLESVIPSDFTLFPV